MREQGYSGHIFINLGSEYNLNRFAFSKYKVIKLEIFVTCLIGDQTELIKTHSLIKNFPGVHNYPTQKEGGVILDCKNILVYEILIVGI